MKKIICPNCGAELEIEDDRESIFCSYCGKNIILKVDDNSKITNMLDEGELAIKNNDYVKAVMAYKMAVELDESNLDNVIKLAEITKYALNKFYEENLETYKSNTNKHITARISLSPIERELKISRDYANGLLKKLGHYDEKYATTDTEKEIAEYRLKTKKISTIVGILIGVAIVAIFIVSMFID